jgi:hypothetical protein
MKMREKIKIKKSYKRYQFMKQRFLLLVALYLFLIGVKAQQVDRLSALPYRYQQAASDLKVAADSIVLPFVEDFSKYYYSSIPDQSKFTDQSVYVNNELVRNPVTIGVATFDGLNAAGLPYVTPSNPVSSSSILSDILTSRPFKWGVTAPLLSDSIYFSFYYKSKGLGNEPEKADSLMLEFRDPVSNVWDRVWSKEGGIVATIDTNFKLVMLGIKQVKYLKRGFQFRFKNKSNGTGSVDLWHIDYIYINKGRFAADINPFTEVAYTSKDFRVFRKYHAMPYQQYLGKVDLNGRFDNSYRNLKRSGTGISRIFSFNYKITGPTTFNTNSTFGCDIDSNNMVCQEVKKDTFAYTFPTALVNSGRKCFDLRHYIETDIVTNPAFKQIKQNDTLYQKVCFDDYFALDDGSAEAAYFVNLPNTGIVGRFQINKKDTLRALDLFFLPVLNNSATANNRFNIIVYGNDNNKPAKDSIFKDVDMQPYFTNGYGLFNRYILTTPQVLDAGVYYIGFKQKSDSLQIGFDYNTDNQDNFYYKVGSSWNNISFNGTPMIRPAFGDISVGIPSVKSIQNNEWLAYPNPVNETLTIQNKKYGDVFYTDFKVEITNILGQYLLKERFRNNQHALNLSQFQEGIYFVKVLDNANQVLQTFKIHIKH